MLAKMTEEASEDYGQLKADIERFFKPLVRSFLSEQIKLLPKNRRFFSPSNASTLIQAFETEACNLETLDPASSENAKAIDHWKKSFTRNVLVPGYLIKDPHLSLPHILSLIKESLVEACQEMKMESYVEICKQTLLIALKNEPLADRMKKARLILTSSIKMIQKLEKNFSKEKFLTYFPKETLQELVDQANEPLPPKTVNSNKSAKISQRPPKISKPVAIEGIDREKLRNYLKSRLLAESTEELKKAPSLLAKLQVITRLLSTLERGKPYLATWLNEWSEKPALPENLLHMAAKQELPRLFLFIRAEILARNCFEEIMSLKERVSFSDFGKERKAVIERYMRCFLQEEPLQELFLKAFHEEERTERERFLPPASDNFVPPSAKPPGQKSLWQKV